MPSTSLANAALVRLQVKNFTVTMLGGVVTIFHTPCRPHPAELSMLGAVCRKCGYRVGQEIPIKLLKSVNTNCLTDWMNGYVARQW